MCLVNLTDYFSQENTEKGLCLEKTLHLYFSVFDTYESVIEKRVSRQQKQLEIKERDQIINDLTQKYSSLTKSNDKLVLDYT